MSNLKRRIEKLEQTQRGKPGAMLRLADAVGTFDMEAWWAQIEADRAAGITDQERAERDLQRDLARYPHPDDRAEILHWHEIRLRNIEQWAAIPDCS